MSFFLTIVGFAFLGFSLIFLVIHRKNLRFFWENRSFLFLTFRHLFVLSVFRIWIEKEFFKGMGAVCCSLFFMDFAQFSDLIFKYKTHQPELFSLLLCGVVLGFVFAFFIVQVSIRVIQSQWIPWIHQNPETVEMLLGQKNEKRACLEKQQLNRKLPQNPTPNTPQKHIKRI